MFYRTLLLSVSSSLDNLAVGFSLGIREEQKRSNKQQPRKRRRKRGSLDVGLNSIISTCNAAGAFLSTLVGSKFGHIAPFLSGIAAAVLFFVLAISELKSSTHFNNYLSCSTTSLNDKTDGVKKKEKENPSLLSSLSSFVSNDDDGTMAENTENGIDIKKAFQLALPMTLNNLAGGMAGGMAGSGPAEMCIAAWIASFGLMQMGFMFGSSSSCLFSSSGGTSSSGNGNSTGTLGLGDDPALISAGVFFLLGLMQIADVCF